MILALFIVAVAAFCTGYVLGHHEGEESGYDEFLREQGELDARRRRDLRKYNERAAHERRNGCSNGVG